MIITKKAAKHEVTEILIVIGTLGTSPKGLKRRPKKLDIGGRIETIQIIALLRSARILRRVLETGGDLLSTRPQRMKNSQEVKEMVIPIVVGALGKSPKD